MKVRVCTSAAHSVSETQKISTHAGRMHGFQLWGNLSSSLKVTAPRYQEVKADEIPEITDHDEHAGAAAAGLRGTTRRDFPETE
ncbi:MAG: hypothetical protein ACLPVW_04875 [Terriglobales bacterium]